MLLLECYYSGVNSLDLQLRKFNLKKFCSLTQYQNFQEQNIINKLRSNNIKIEIEMKDKIFI